MTWLSRAQQEQEKPVATSSPGAMAQAGPLLTARVTRSCSACLRYRWEEGHLWVDGLTPGSPELPADLAVSTPEPGLDLQLLLLLPQSAPPETWLRVRVLGALQPAPAAEPASWLWLATLATEEAETEALPPWLEQRLAEPAWRRRVEEFWRLERPTGSEATGRSEGSTGEEPAQRWLTAEEAAQALRALRAARRQTRRAQQVPTARGTLSASASMERPLNWQTAASLAGLNSALRAGGLLLRADASLPFAEPARLLRLVAPRFQAVLGQLLAEDEQVLAFVERPPLRRAAGWLRRQQTRLTEGLLLVSDRQVLWLRAYFAQGSSFTEGGYVARTLPIERLQACWIEPAARAGARRLPLGGQEPPLLRFGLRVTAALGEETLRVEFPPVPGAEEALRRLQAVIEPFLPLPAQQRATEQRLRVWPTISPWQPERRRLEELSDLGGRLPESLARRAEEALLAWLTAQGLGREEVLLTLGLPALAEYGSPPRWLALTRRALLVWEAETAQVTSKEPLRLRCFAPWNLSSLELRYSLLGSGLTLYEPRAAGSVTRYDLPFAGPALALVLPLFERLRTLLRLMPGMQARLTGTACAEKGAVQ